MNALQVIGSPLLLLGIVELVFGIFCIAKTKRNNFLPLYAGAGAIFCGIFSISAALAYILASFNLNYAIFYRLAWAGYLCCPTFIHLIYELRARPNALTRTVILMLYPFWAIVYLLTLTTDLVDIEPSSFIPYVDRGGPLEMPIRYIALLQFCWLFYALFQLKKESVGMRRQQTEYLILGTMMFCVAAILTAGGLGGRPTFDPGLTSYFSLPWIALTIYAVTRHRLFDIRMAISRVLIGLTLICIFGGFHMFAYQVFKSIIGSEFAITLSGISTVVLIFGSPLTAVVRKWINAFFLKTSIDYQEAIKNSSGALASILNLDDLLRRFVELTQKSLGVEDAGFYLLNGDRYELRYALREVTNPNDLQLDAKSKIVQWLNNEKQVLVREERVSEFSKMEAAKLDEEFSKRLAEAAVPIFNKNNLSGFLTLGYKSSKDPFFQNDINFLETLASHAALAIENSKLFEEATTDGLTGLYHQKYFKTRLKAEYERAKRHGHNLILLLVDVDHFKKVNDSYGHLAGDNILKGVAKIIHNSFRIEDIVARYGGEEFAVLLNEPHISGAREAAERLRSRIESHTFEKGIRVSVSIGMHVFNAQSLCQSEEDIIKNADDALYKAKETGRNRVVYFEEMSQIRRLGK